MNLKKNKEPGIFDVRINDKESFTIDNIFTLGKNSIYIQEVTQGHNIKAPVRKKVERNNSTDSLEEANKVSINDMIEQGKREISRLRDIDKKLLHPESKDLSEVLMNAIKQIEEMKEGENEEEEKESKKDKNSESDSEDDLEKKQKDNKVKEKETKEETTFQKKELKEKFADFKRSQVDPHYQEQLEEVDRIKKALTNKDIHLDMKIIRRAVLMSMFEGA